MNSSNLFSLVILLVTLPATTFAQVTRADYQRAASLRDRLQGLAVNVPERANWIEKSPRFWYRKSVKGGHEFVLVDAKAAIKRAAFDHARLAASLSTASGEKYEALKLPFQSIRFEENESALTFELTGTMWRCELADYTCRKTGEMPRGFGSVQRPPEGHEAESMGEFSNDVANGMAAPAPQQEPRRNDTPSPGQTFKASPDGQWEALIQNYNVFLRPKGKKETMALSFDGSEGNYYTLASIAWSPDSKRLVAYHVKPGYRREVHYVESSPADQLQPKHSTREYAKPGDALDIAQPVLFEIATKKQTVVDNHLFPNPFSLSPPIWWKDGRGFTFEYNQRGHQVYRVIEVDSASGQARELIAEEPKTFFSYRPLQPDHTGSGSRYRFNINDGKELIWLSERDGWRHLYLYDAATGRVKNQITKGDWVVRGVSYVDETKRQIWFLASGMYPGRDPYFIHAYRINFDGTGLTTLTDADADHTFVISPDQRYFVDIWSRVDLAPVAELRRADDKKLILELEKADISALVAAGWRAPVTFVAPGRDGKTEIWGVIHKPSNFDAGKKYPVIEAIYAGPQGSFVPKNFRVAIQSLTELGFVVAQIDGMGTNNRSKAFHDVAWRNLGDAGFPDRILWHKAVAQKFPWYDITRVGVYGTSAGGQNAAGAVLFQPEFYHVAVANSGCHDNRMDKIWWNEQWMGWPLGPHYAAASNVENAHRLQGKLLLVVPEMDTNVDPASTWQVVNALIKANKKFDLLFVTGGGHGAGGAYYQRLLADFFVHHLQGAEPPDWNKTAATSSN